MTTFKSEYDFYDLSEDARKALIGKSYKCTGRNDFYFPIELIDEGENYGIKQGVIFVTPIMKFGKERKKWFRVGAFSPDDLDMDLDFGAEDTHKRQEIITYLKKMNKINVTYESVLKEIQQHFGGKLT
jgi:hypothetical protein